MSTIKTEKAAHNITVNVAESARQSISTASTALQARTAEIAFYRAGRASAIANDCSPVPFIIALRDLGTDGT